MKKHLSKFSKNVSYPWLAVLFIVSIVVSTITQYNHLAYTVLDYSSTEFDSVVLQVAYDDGIIWGIMVFLITGLLPLIVMLIKPTKKIIKRSTIVWSALAFALLFFLWLGSHPWNFEVRAQDFKKDLELEKYDQAEKQKKYVNEKNDFAISFPYSWSEIETAGKTVWEIQYDQNQRVSSCFIRAHDDESFKMINNEDYLGAISKKQMSKELGSFFDEYSINSWNENGIFADIKPALEYNYTVKPPNSDNKQTTLIKQVIHDNKLFTFSCKAEQETFFEMKDVFEEIAATFKFEN